MENSSDRQRLIPEFSDLRLRWYSLQIDEPCLSVLVGVGKGDGIFSRSSKLISIQPTKSGSSPVSISVLTGGCCSMPPLLGGSIRVCRVSYHSVLLSNKNSVIKHLY